MEREYFEARSWAYAAATPSFAITGVGFNDYDVIGDAYFLSAIF